MRKEGAATLNDVAARAGVNKVTASIVLSGGRGNTRVSDATRQRILDAAGELQYLPNALAQSLRRRRTHTLGFYMGGFIDTRDLFLSEIVSGLQQGCEQNRHDFLMHGTFRGDSTGDIYAELLNGKVDGLVLHVPSGDPLVPRLAASRLPVVAVANPVPNLASVTVDDAGGSRLLARHLAEKGHRRVAYAVSPFKLSAAVRRYEAFLQAADECDMPVTAERARDAAGILSDFEQAYLALPARERPTAIVCWNDHFAYVLIERFRALGIRVPDDVAVAGFDGSTTLIPPAYRLTTVRAPWREVARTAVALLIENQGKPAPDETTLPVELVAGDTA